MPNDVGAAGAAAGSALIVEVFEPSPAAFTARTRNAYVVPLESPEIVAPVVTVVVDVVHVTPPSMERSTT